VKPSLRPKINGSKDAYELLKENSDASRIEFVEQFKAVLLNRANEVLGILEVSTGGVSGTVSDLCGCYQSKCQQFFSRS